MCPGVFDKMAGMSYGKRMLKAGLQKSGSLKKAKYLSPDEEAEYYCDAGIDKDGFTVKYISDYKGFGVFATQNFLAGDFLLQYTGEKISKEEAKRRMEKNSENKFFFHFLKGKQCCIDGEASSGHICQYVNDATEAKSNAVMKLKFFNGIDYLCLFAKKKIQSSEEIVYNYGDGSNLWWRKKESTQNNVYDYDSDSDPFEVESSDLESESSESYVSDSEFFELSDTVPIHKDSSARAPCGALPELETWSKDIAPKVQTASEENTLKMQTDLNESTLEVRTDTQEARIECKTASQEARLDMQTASEETTQKKQTDLNESTLELRTGTQEARIECETPSQETRLDMQTASEETTLKMQTDLNALMLEVRTDTQEARIECETPSQEARLDMQTASEETTLKMQTDLNESTLEVRTGTQEARIEYNYKTASQEKKTKPGKKPDRFCIYCKSLILNGKLKRHIIRKHKCEPDVQNILKKPEYMQNNFFDEKRREGIFEYNTNLIASGNDPKMRERRPKVEDQLRFCVDCKSFLSSRYFFKHKCATETPQPLKPQLLEKACEDKANTDVEFRSILNRFRDGVVGDLCRSDKFIKMIGYRHYNLRRHEEGKQDEVRKVVMSEMRELGKLFLEFQTLTGYHTTVEDMFSRQYLQHLVQALQQLVVAERSEKHGQKLFLNAILLRSIKSLSGFYSETMQDEKRKELKNFRIAYKHKSHELFPGARQACIKNTLEKSRKPANLPNEVAVKRLKDYIAAEITSVLQEYTLRKYTRLRSLVVARLTLYNARRGEEASRILQTEWEDAEKGVWLQPEEIEKVNDPAEQYLLGKFKLAYLKGKGKKYVPVLIPIDLIDAIKILNEDRLNFGVKPENIFLFATKNRRSHCSGWHAVADVCSWAGLKIPVTATKMRHRLSSIFASFDMSAENQKLFLEHMGHEMNINKENYQCPQGVRAVCLMGKMLNSIDEDSCQGSTEDILVRRDSKNKVFPVKSSRNNCNLDFSSSSSETEVIDVQDSDATEEIVDTEMVDMQAFIETEMIDIQVQAYGITKEAVDTEMVDTPAFDSDEAKVNTRKGKIVSVKWSDADTQLIRDYFKDCLFAKTGQANNKGNLPSKDCIMNFLDAKKPSSVAALAKHEQYVKTRAKLFNERKSIRGKTVQTLKKIGCSKI